MTIDFEQTEELDVFSNDVEEEIEQGLPMDIAATAAAQASYVIGTNLAEDYGRINQDLLITGKSEDIRIIANRAREEEELVDQEAVSSIVTDPSIPNAQKAKLLSAAIDIKNERETAPLWDSYSKVVVEAYDGEASPAYRVQQQLRAIELEGEQDAVRNQIETLKPQAVDLKRIGDNVGVAIVTDLLDLSLPRSHANTIAKLYTHMLGEEPSYWDGFWTGNMYGILKDDFDSKDNKAKVEWAEKAVVFFKGNVNWVKDQNVFETMTTLETLLNVDRTAEDFDWDKLIENIIVPLDLVTVGGWARLGVEGFSTTLGVATRTNPEMARTLAASNIISNNSEASRAMGQTVPHMLLATHFPRKGTGGGALSGAPVDVVELAHELTLDATKILDRYIVDNPTSKRLIKDIVERNSGGKIHVNKSWARAVGDVHVVKAIVGATAARGYTTVQGAIRAADRRGLKEDITALWKRNKSGTIVKVTDKSITDIIDPTTLPPVRLSHPSQRPDDLNVAFKAMARAQRGPAEKAMLTYANQMDSGSYAHVLEHVGDLTHRMGQSSFSGKVPAHREKVEIGLKGVDDAVRSRNSLTSFQQERQGHLEMLAAKPGNTLESVQALDKKLRADYVKQHKKVPVFNEAQWRARESAIAVGELRIKDAIEHLNWLEKAMSSKGWQQKATTVTRDKQGKILEFGKTTEVPARGEYFFEWSTTEKLPAELPSIDFGKVTPFKATTIKPQLSKYFSDVNALFGPEDSLRLGALSDFEAAVKSKIDLLNKDFKKLNAADQQDAYILLAKGATDKGDGLPGVITYHDAITGTDSINAVSKKAYKAYMGLVTQSDLTYLTMNSRVRTGLLNEGYDAIQEVDGVISYGQRLQGDKAFQALRNVDEVLEVSTGKPLRLTDEIKKSISINQGQVYALRSEERIGDSAYNFMYVPADKLSKIKPIPDDPLPYIDGYIFRKHEDQYYIELVNPNVRVDGKAALAERTHVTGAAASLNEAKSTLETMKAEFISPEDALAGVTMRIRFGREVVKDMNAGQSSFELAMANGLIHKGKRGALLNKEGGGLSNVLPTFEAMQSSISKAAAHLSKIPVIEEAERDFIKFFGDKVGILQRNNDNVYSFPLTSNAIPKPKDPALLPLYRQAVASWDYINMIGRYSDPVTAGWRSGLLLTAEVIDSKVGGAAGHKVANFLSKKDPLDAMKSFAFHSFIASNPFRQLPLQLSQHLSLLPLAPLYMGSGKAMKDAVFMSIGASMRHTEAWSKHASKLARGRGLTVKEYTKEVDDWLDSGLPQSIDSHSYLSGMLLNPTETIGRSVGGKLATHTGNFIKAPLRFARKIGFNAGEIGNLAVTWQVLRHTGAREGKTFNALEHGQRVRQTTFSMSQSGELGYQRGALKAFTQFFSFQHKAIAAVLGANPAFSGRQRASIAATQMAMFGAGSFGMVAVYNSIAERYTDLTDEVIDPELHRKISHGFGTALVNEGLKDIAELYGLDKEKNKDTFIDFSSFAPFSGATFPVGSLFDLFFDDNPLYEQMFGASGTAIRRTSKAWDGVSYMFAAANEDDDPAALLLEAFKIMGRGTSSGLSNYYKGMVSENAKAFIDSYGDETVKATLLEAWAKASMGLGSYKESVYREAKHDWAVREREEKEEVRKMVSGMIHLYDARDKNESLDDTMGHMQHLASWLYATDNEHKSRFKDMFREEYLRRMEVRSGSSDLLQDYMKRVAADMDVGSVYYNILALAEGETREGYRVLLDEIFLSESQNKLNAEEEEEKD